MRPLPDHLLTGPFLRATALAAGVTPRVLEGARFVRVHPLVYRHRDHAMSHADVRLAARLALPDHCHLTGISRIQDLGLGFGPLTPVRFVVEGDLHLAVDGTFLHRTRALPPHDANGVSPEAAYLSYCARARTIDAIKVGDWLLHHGHATADSIRGLALSALWRDGAYEAIWVTDHLVASSRSLPESEVRSLLDVGGLPTPQPNGPVRVGDVTVHGDLVLHDWRTVVEYEGAQHQESRDQYLTDVDRYALYRDHDISYVQVTKESLRRPRQVVRQIHEALVRRGYAGPEPDFGPRWEQMFSRLSVAVGPRHPGER